MDHLCKHVCPNFILTLSLLMVSVTTMLINSYSRQVFIEGEVYNAMAKAGLGSPVKDKEKMTKAEKKIRDEVEVPILLNALFLLPTLAVLGCLLNLSISIYNKFKGGSTTTYKLSSNYGTDTFTF
jgi:hypothetical protein